MVNQETKEIAQVIGFTILFSAACLATVFGFLGVVKFLWGGNLG